MVSPASLGLIWFLYMAGMGMIFPYQSLYLSENVGLTGTELGLVLAIRPLVGMLAQPAWGHVADRTGSRSRVLGGLMLGAACFHVVFPLAEGFLALLVVMAAASVFATSVMPMNTSVTLASLGGDPTLRYGRIRVWGTIGFFVLVVGFPPLLHTIQRQFGLVAVPGGPSEPGLGSMFWIAAVFALAAAVIVFRLPRGGALAVRSERGDFRRLLAHGPFRRVLIYAFFAYLMLQGPILLFPVFVRDLGGSLDTVSRMWIPMIALEIPLVLYSGAAIARIGPRALLMIGVLADGLRWTVCAVSGDLRVVFAMQLLHGVVIAGMIVGLQLYAESVVPERLRSTAQGVLAMVGPSIGGILSVAGAGILLDHYGARMPYLVGGVGALLLAALTFPLLPRPRS